MSCPAVPTPSCIGHVRLVPTFLVDVAGLVPGAADGRGRGNAFLSDLANCDALIQVVDAAGLTDIEGNLVAEAQSKTNRRYNNFNLEIDGGTAFWNGKNMHNNSVSSGVYLVMLSDLDSYETKILKIMIIR